MKNKKGFTLVEIIAVVAILVIIAGIFSVNMIQTLNKNRTEEQENLTTQIYSAANAYVAASPEVIEPLYNGSAYVDITVKKMKETGYLGDNLVDPTTGENISDDVKIRVYLKGGDYLDFVQVDENGTVDPASGGNDIQFYDGQSYALKAEPLTVNFNSNGSNWCNQGDNKYTGFCNGKTPGEASIVSKLYLMKGSSIIPVEKSDIKVVSCNVNAAKAGQYKITYEYTDKEINTKIIQEREVYVTASGEDIVSFTATINNGKVIPVNTNNDTSYIPIQITEKDRNNKTHVVEAVKTVADLNASGYSISQFNISKAITNANATISSIKVNSDGSRPSAAQAKYTVASSVATILNSLNLCSVGSGSCYVTSNQAAETNYVTYNGTNNVYRVYGLVKNDGQYYAKLMYFNDDIVGAYAQLGNCHPMSCCNGGRYIYYSIQQDTNSDRDIVVAGQESTYYSDPSKGGKGFMYKFMHQHLDDFEKTKVKNAQSREVSYVLEDGRTYKESGKVLLLSSSEYSALNPHYSSNHWLLNGLNETSSTKNGFWLVDNAINWKPGYGGAGSNLASVYTRYVGFDGKISYAGASKGNNNVYDQKLLWSTKAGITTTQLLIRPTILVKISSISNGFGTKDKPFVIN